MGFTNSKHAKMLGIMGMAAFVTVAVFGVSHTLGMEMKDDGTMGGCLFDGRAEICPMTLIEHLSVWQGMFTATPQKAGLFSLLVILATAFVVLIFSQHFRLLLLGLLTSRHKLYLRVNPQLLLFDPLKEAFSQGILNPKIYELATL